MGGRTLSIALAALLAAGTLCACRREPAAADFPPGTVLALDGLPLSAEEVDRVAERLRSISPNFALPHLRRLALTNHFFPLLTARATADSGARERARAEAEAARDAWVEGRAQGPLESEEGNWQTLGLEVWLAVSELEPDAWSPVFELPGAFAFAHLAARDHAARAIQEDFRVELSRFPYHEAIASIEDSVFEQRLTIVDPAWERIVPGAWKTRMTVETRP